MSWYYAHGGQQQGPVDDAQFDLMIQSGQIKGADLVWKEGMANWQPLSTVRPDVAFTAPAAPLPASLGAPPVVSGLNPDEITCVECHGRFAKDNAIQYGSTWVCASCKPVFVQKLKEGASVGTPMAAGLGTMNFAGFWIRFAAKFIDSLILSVIVLVPVLFIVFAMVSSAGQTGQGGPPPVIAVIQLVAQVIYILVLVAYNTFFVGKWGATPGKMAVGLKIVTAEGEPVSFMRAFGRAWAEQLNTFTCTIGYIIAAFDSEKRALHDHICSTRVVFK